MKTKKTKQLGIVEVAFSPSRPGEIALIVGQRIVVRAGAEDGRKWLAGYIQGERERKGIFPRRCVRLLAATPTPVAHGKATKVAIAAVPAPVPAAPDHKAATFEPQDQRSVLAVTRPRPTTPEPRRGSSAVSKHSTPRQEKRSGPHDHDHDDSPPLGGVPATAKAVRPATGEAMAREAVAAARAAAARATPLIRQQQQQQRQHQAAVTAPEPEPEAQPELEPEPLEPEPVSVVATQQQQQPHEPPDNHSAAAQAAVSVSAADAPGQFQLLPVSSSSTDAAKGTGLSSSAGAAQQRSAHTFSLPSVCYWSRCSA